MVNFLNGRGKRIYAEADLSADIVRDILKTDAASLCEVQYRKNLLGSAMAGAMGCNAHHANMLAAFFIATGQDVAQVAESAMGITCIEARANGAEKAGGAAKICGAGALSGDQAGAPLVIGAPDLPELARYRKIDAPLAVDGLQIREI
jgi:hypothetical protein